MKCWICGGDANSGEHKTKQSDLRSVLGTPSQGRPFFYHDKTTKNRPIGSFNGQFLKSKSRLCSNCNNALTQPYDRAWEHLSEALRERRPELKAHDVVRCNRVFPDFTSQCMRDVQLYFTKLTGCHLVEASLTFDQSGMSSSLLLRQPNPYIFLKFGIGAGGIVGMADLHVATLAADGSCAYAAWQYCLDRIVVQVMYAIKGEQREGLIDAWHPSLGTNRLRIADFS